MSERPCPKCGKGCTACFDAGYSHVRPLESQNQALQEERDELKDNEHHARLAQRALQERAEKAEAELAAIKAHPMDYALNNCGPGVVLPDDAFSDALSPTQETDPE